MFPPNHCSGCGTCAQLCPVHAIKSEKNLEGFFYPSVDTEKCVHCGLCEKRCPVLNPLAPRSSLPQAYACRNFDESVRANSSSGGIFSLLAEHILRLGGIVVGCAMTEDCYAAEHRVIADPSELYMLRGSKYMQSRADYTFPAVKEALLNRKWVLFSGTPCQVQGLHSYLGGVNTDKLISADIICHGVPSPAVWEKYVRRFEADRGAKAISVEFRNKEKGWTPYSLVLTFDNCEVYSEVCTKDLYCKGFVADCFLRRSCYSCASKDSFRTADITLGDMWGVRNVCPSMDDNRGTSLVLLHTLKGEEIFRKIASDVEWQKADFEEAVRHNPSYRRSSARIPYREHFMKQFHKKDILLLLEKELDTGVVARIKRKFIKFSYYKKM